VSNVERESPIVPAVRARRRIVNRQLTIANPSSRSVVVLGVGNRLRGDDAIGCIVCDELQGAGESPIANRQSPIASDVFVLDCGNTPENYIQPVADRKPARILVVDCCNYGAKPGEFRLFSREEVDRLSYGLLSTHTLPLTLTIEMLSLETRAAIELLGIQPERIEFGEDLSDPVQRALPAAVEFVRSWVLA
jgi:hydrogenase 3 maturation protease